MYIIKEKPEDFVVEEVTNVQKKKDGSYVYFWVKKRGLNTLQVMEYLAKALRINLKFINFAGTKDKNAITTQLVSVKGRRWEQISRVNIKDVSFEFYGYGNERLHLGDLVGNKFRIRISNVDTSLLEKKRIFINYFGEQRFSKYNVMIGKAIVKEDFVIAIDLMHKANPFYSRKMDDYLKEQKNNFVGALKLMPKKLLRLYVNSYQSYMWNETVRMHLKAGGKLQEVPMIGFGTEVEDDELRKIIKGIMKVEELNYRDFIIRKLPELSAEGDLRKVYMDIKDFEVVNKNKKEVLVSFQLGKGSYATEVIRQIFEK